MRIYAEVEDQVNEELDQAAISEGSNKKAIVARAIDLYLHQDRSSQDQITRERDQLRSERDQLRSDYDLRWKELQQLRSELNQAKRDLETARSREDLLRSERDLARSDKDQASGELSALQLTLEHYKETMRLKDSEISFLRGHVSQISEKLPKALPPAEEEIQKKGWWQFWK